MKILNMQILSQNEPFVFLKNDSVNRIGNDQYQGFLIDLLENVSDRTTFEFVLKLQEDGRYGMQLDDGNWNGKKQAQYFNFDLI